MKNTIKGMHYFIQGLRLITQPGLKRFVIIPLLINIILFIGLFFLLRSLVVTFNSWFSQFLPSWLQWLNIIFWILFFLGFFVIVIYAFVIIANIISAPFNSFLAEKVEYYLTNTLPESRSLMQNIKDIPRGIGRQLIILGQYLPLALFVLILFFIPIIHLAAPIIAFLFHAWFMTFTYVDYPTDNHRIPISEMRLWLQERRGTSLGFGAIVMLASMIPIFNFFVIPAAVAGATLFWVRENKLKQN